MHPDGLHQESKYNPGIVPGVHLESIRTSQGSSHGASCWTPGILLMESIRIHTIPGLLIQPNPSRTLPIVQMDSTKANLIQNGAKKHLTFCRFEHSTFRSNNKVCT